MDILREKIARAAALAIGKQDGYESDGLDENLCIGWIDQGDTDFGLVADAILAIPELKEAPLHQRILMVLGGERDNMSREDVEAVQRFAAKCANR